ncbi:MAG: WYL domain-containing protein [Spirochaetales bacterium]|nr:WYL domain-containing protein [Spirochaetales bacterium]
MKKQDKLAFIEQLLLAHPSGLKRSEIAKKMGAHRSTVGRCIDDLSRVIPVVEDGHRLYIDKSRYLNNVKLTLHEVFCFYLASRLLFVTYNRYSPHVYSGMTKLAAALEHSSPLLSGFIGASAEHQLGLSQSEWKDQIDILEKLTLAWAENRKVTLLYRSKTSGEIHQYTASIYFMEPYPAGKTIYLFAQSDGDDFIRTFRTDRITAVELLNEGYSIPADFDFSGLFANAWGIWDTQGKATEVLIRFSERVAERVTETVWHPSQRVKPEKAGSVLFSASVSEPLEMVPWIRGWGSDCEVLAPEELRAFMREEAGRLGDLYE